MELSEIQSIVKLIIVDKLGISESEITPNTSFFNDLRADSLDLIELVMEFERKFHISIPDIHFKKLKTVNDVIEYVYNAKKT